MNLLDRLLVEVVAEAERVGSGGESQDGGFRHSPRPADPLHLERVGEDQPVEAELAAQEAGEDRPADRRGRVVERGHEQVARHHRLDTGLDRGAEGQQRGGEVVADRRQLAVRVDGGVAVAGKVLGARGDTLALRARDEGRHVARHELGVGPEAAHSDHGVARIRVRVRDRRHVQVHAGARELAGDRARDLLRQRHVVDGPEREVAGVRAAVLRLEPRDVSALLVDRDQQLGPLGSEGCRQLRELRGIADVVGEEGDPAEPALEPARDPLGHDVTGEARLQARGGLPLELAHCLTAPAVRPNAIRRCTSTKKTTTGRAVSVEAAISVPQSTPRVVPVMKFASQIVIVCLSALESMT